MVRAFCLIVPRAFYRAAETVTARCSEERRHACVFIASITWPEDCNGYTEYVEQVKPIVEKHGGVYLARTDNIEVFSSDWKPDRVIIIRFNSREDLDACFSEPEYMAIMELRQDDVRVRVVLVEGFPEVL